MSTPSNQSDPVSNEFMSLAAAAVQLKKLYDAYVSAGFTEQQAMSLLISLMTSRAPSHRAMEGEI